jgi:hypothetical protein
MEPSEKSPAITEFLESSYGRSTAIKGNMCLPAPIGCGREIPASEIVGTWDSLTTREYRISGMCKTCQDAFYDMAEDDFSEPIPGIAVI